jgi:hypothetical protein
MRKTLAFLVAAIALAGPAAAATPQELFRIAFGPDRAELGAQVQGANFSFPRDFSMDTAGRFYIYDTIKHRIARYSHLGIFQMSLAYPVTARQVFAHADAHDNLWLLVADPGRGIFYGVYDAHGKILRQAVFAQFNQFRFHLDDDYVLHLILSSAQSPAVTQTFLFDEDRLLLKREMIARPPEDHHRVVQQDRRFYIDAVPGTSRGGQAVNRITDESHRTVAEIEGKVVYITAAGDVYTRTSECRLNRYDVAGHLRDRLNLTGLPSSCAALRFDPAGAIYQLDGIPEPDGQYTPRMAGMRVIVWQPAGQ